MKCERCSDDVPNRFAHVDLVWACEKARTISDIHGDRERANLEEARRIDTEKRYVYALERCATAERERDEARQNARADLAVTKRIAEERDTAEKRIHELEAALRDMTHEGCRERRDGECVLGHEECEKANAALSTPVKDDDDDADCLVCHGTGNVFFDGRDLECPCVRHKGAPAQPATATKEPPRHTHNEKPGERCEGCQGVDPTAPAAVKSYSVCLGCGHFKHSNRCNCGCTMRPVEGDK